MNKYEGSRCPVCNIPFKGNDDIVVCPDCGAPHHRECYAKRGACAYADQHGAGFTWEDIRPKNEPGTGGGNVKKCPRCDTPNPISSRFCSLCGTPLNGPKDENAFDPFGGQPGAGQGNGQGGSPFGAGPQGAPFGGMPPFGVMGYDPLGGVNKNEKIDEEKVTDVATCVATRTDYYVPRFHKMSKEKKKAGWNWAAFLLGPYWMMFRKIYGVGSLFMIVTVVASMLVAAFETVLFASAEANTTYEQLMATALREENRPFLLLVLLIFFVLVVCHLVMGIFGNYFYYRSTIARVKKTRAKAEEEEMEPQQYMLVLVSAGGVNMLLPVLLYVVQPLLSNMIYVFFMV